MNPTGEHPMPTARLEEVIYVLQELARLVVHPNTASVLPLNLTLRGVLEKEAHLGRRIHLLILFPSFCELVISRLDSVLLIFFKFLNKI